MAFVATSTCVTSKHFAHTLAHEEKIALVTDLFLSTVAIALATLFILQTRGVIDLSRVSVLSSVGLKPALIMAASGGGVISVDVVKLCLQAQHRASHLSSHIQTVQTEAAAQVRQANADAEQAREAAAAHEAKATRLTEENARLQKALDDRKILERLLRTHTGPLAPDLETVAIDVLGGHHDDDLGDLSGNGDDADDLAGADAAEGVILVRDAAAAASPALPANGPPSGRRSGAGAGAAAVDLIGRERLKSDTPPQMSSTCEDYARTQIRMGPAFGRRLTLWIEGITEWAETSSTATSRMTANESEDEDASDLLNNSLINAVDEHTPFDQLDQSVRQYLSSLRAWVHEGDPSDAEIEARKAQALKSCEAEIGRIKTTTDRPDLNASRASLKEAEFARSRIDADRLAEEQKKQFRKALQLDYEGSKYTLPEEFPEFGAAIKPEIGGKLALAKLGDTPEKSIPILRDLLATVMEAKGRFDLDDDEYCGANHETELDAFDELASPLMGYVSDLLSVRQIEPTHLGLIAVEAEPLEVDDL